MQSIVVVGAAGYTGGELIRMLIAHPRVVQGAYRLVCMSSSHEGQPVIVAHPDLLGMCDLVFTNTLPDDAAVVFLCLGHGKSAPWIQYRALPDACVVIDLSHDHRLDPSWAYGLPERNREAIASSTRIANPGCFATCIELALLPLSLHGMLPASIHTTAITGSTGAGQAPSDTTHYSWRAHNLSVYKAFDHQHLPEIERTIGRRPILVPMRGPFTRGILATSVLECTASEDELRELYHATYATHPFTHVANDLPDVKRVVNTNNCQIGLQRSDDRLLVVSVIDNLVKGASGQAIQNMNLALHFEETEGLHFKALAY